MVFGHDYVVPSTLATSLQRPVFPPRRKTQMPTPVPPPENKSRTRLTSMVKATLNTIQNRQPPPRQPLPPPPPNTIIPDSSPRRSRLRPFRPSVLLMALPWSSLGGYSSCRPPKEKPEGRDFRVPALPRACSSGCAR